MVQLRRLDCSGRSQPNRFIWFLERVIAQGPVQTCWVGHFDDCSHMLWLLAAVNIICWRPHRAKVLLVCHNAPQTKLSIADSPSNRGSVEGVRTMHWSLRGEEGKRGRGGGEEGEGTTTPTLYLFHEHAAQDRVSPRPVFLMQVNSPALEHRVSPRLVDVH